MTHRKDKFKRKWTSKVIPRRFKRLVFEPPFHIIQELLPKLEDSVGCEEPTMEELQAKGVPQDQWTYYFGFMKRLLEMYRDFSGATLELEITSLIEEYVLRGHNRNVLEQIRGVVARECVMSALFYEYWNYLSQPSFVLQHSEDWSA